MLERMYVLQAKIESGLYSEEAVAVWEEELAYIEALMVKE